MLSHRECTMLLAGMILAAALTPRASAQAENPSEATSALPAGAVATVNGIPISSAKIDERAWREWGPVYTDYAIRSQIVRQEAARRGLSVTPEELQARMVEYQAQFNAVPGRQPRDWEDFLHRYGRSEIESRQRDELLAGKIGADEAKKAALSDDEKTHVIADLERASHKVHVRHILVGIGPAYAGRTEEQAQTRAEEVRGKLAAGGSWNDVALAYSDDVSTREHAGDLGFFTRGQMVKPLEDAAFSATPGPEIRVLRVPDGFDVYQVVERQDTPPTPEQVQAAMDETLKRKQDIASSAVTWYPKVSASYAVVSAMPYDRRASSTRPAQTGRKPTAKKVRPATTR